MEKRALLAVALAFVILLAYQFFFVKPEPQKVRKQPAATEKEKTVPSETQPSPVSALPPVVASRAMALPFEEREIKVDTKLYSAVFTNAGGTLKHFELKKYKDMDGKNVVLLKNPGAEPPLAIGANNNFALANAKFRVSVPDGGKDISLDQNNPTASLIFEYMASGATVRRTYTFHNENYRIDIKDEVTGLPGYWITLGTDFGIHDINEKSAHVGPVLLRDTDRMEFTAKKLNEPKTFKDSLKWIAQEDKYFCAALVPLSTAPEAMVWKIKDSPAIALEGKPGANNFILYAGPKEYDDLKALHVGLENIIDFGFFSIIALPLFWVLKLFYKLTGNYGWSIVFLTILVRIPFIPLVNKSQQSMRKMQQIQPKMAEVREKYKKDPQRMQSEMMQLYKTHKVNPLGGCLPMLLQVPVFFALYKILLIAIELRDAPFMLWIKDLSAPDTLFGHIPLWIPLIGGFAIGPLPILMGVTMVLQQKMTPTSMDPTQNKMMMLMPVVFTFLFLNFASGLVLYWLMNNIFSIVQQVYVNKKLAREAASAS
jgi:YidC/Oxa1 family membrane protein insertase